MIDDVHNFYFSDSFFYSCIWDSLMKVHLFKCNSLISYMLCVGYLHIKSHPCRYYCENKIYEFSTFESSIWILYVILFLKNRWQVVCLFKKKIRRQIVYIVHLIFKHTDDKPSTLFKNNRPTYKVTLVNSGFKTS